jgi:hypothetical protein
MVVVVPMMASLPSRARWSLRSTEEVAVVVAVPVAVTTSTLGVLVVTCLAFLVDGVQLKPLGGGDVYLLCFSIMLV